MPETIWRPEDRPDADRFIVWNCALCGTVLRCPHCSLVPKDAFTDSCLRDPEGD